ncbi:uncharacterized protein AruCF_3382 [Achromobacter ruhlandii]|nr:uncharacterized protein AruCF_3382 [Achromobacter ruhlandii]
MTPAFSAFIPILRHKRTECTSCEPPPWIVRCGDHRYCPAPGR